jgi:hypothetical protein
MTWFFMVPHGSVAEVFSCPSCGFSMSRIYGYIPDQECVEGLLACACMILTSESQQAFDALERRDFEDGFWWGLFSETKAFARTGQDPDHLLAWLRKRGTLGRPGSIRRILDRMTGADTAPTWRGGQTAEASMIPVYVKALRALRELRAMASVISELSKESYSPWIERDEWIGKAKELLAKLEQVPQLSRSDDETADATAT